MPKQSLKTLIDAAWTEQQYSCKKSRVLVYQKRFAAAKEAGNLCDEHLQSLYTEGGAIFVAFTAPIRSRTLEEVEAAIIRGEREKWCVELFAIPQVGFDQLLCFLDHLDYGLGDNSPKGKVALRRKEAKALLNWMQETGGPLAIREISSGHIAGRFLQPLERHRYQMILDKVFAYNRGNFSVELPEAHWRRMWRKSGSFSLGPF